MPVAGMCGLPTRWSATARLIWSSCRALSPNDMFWETALAQFFSRLASFSWLILFDKRGTGLSDRDVGIATLEERMDDVRAVMDAAGSKSAALFGFSEGGAMSLLFAATYPQRARALVLYGSFAWSRL